MEICGGLLDDFGLNGEMTLAIVRIMFSQCLYRGDGLNEAYVELLQAFLPGNCSPETLVFVA